MLIDTGSHRIPTNPPFEKDVVIRFIGSPDGSDLAYGISPGALGTVIRNEPGRQGSSEALFNDEKGLLNDVSMDGYSVVLFEGGVQIAITATQARCFELEMEPTVGLAPR